jgi:hypothetical protein
MQLLQLLFAHVLLVASATANSLYNPGQVDEALQPAVVLPATPADSLLGGSTTSGRFEMSDRSLKTQISLALLQALNDDGSECGVTFESVRLSNEYKSTVEEGTLFDVSGKAQPDNFEFKASLIKIPENEEHPHNLPSSVAAKPADLDKLISFMVQSISPQPCPERKTGLERVGTDDDAEKDNERNQFFTNAHNRTRKAKNPVDQQYSAYGHIDDDPDFIELHSVRAKSHLADSVVDIPASFDWSTKIPNARALKAMSQGACGSCWAWASTTGE